MTFSLLTGFFKRLQVLPLNHFLEKIISVISILIAVFALINYFINSYLWN